MAKHAGTLPVGRFHDRTHMLILGLTFLLTIMFPATAASQLTLSESEVVFSSEVGFLSGAVVDVTVGAAGQIAVLVGDGRIVHWNGVESVVMHAPHLMGPATHIAIAPSSASIVTYHPDAGRAAWLRPESAINRVLPAPQMEVVSFEVNEEDGLLFSGIDNRTGPSPTYVLSRCSAASCVRIPGFQASATNASLVKVGRGSFLYVAPASGVSFRPRARDVAVTVASQRIRRAVKRVWEPRRDVFADLAVTGAAALSDSTLLVSTFFQAAGRSCLVRLTEQGASDEAACWPGLFKVVAATGNRLVVVRQLANLEVIVYRYSFGDP